MKKYVDGQIQLVDNSFTQTDNAPEGKTMKAQDKKSKMYAALQRMLKNIYEANRAIPSSTTFDRHYKRYEKARVELEELINSVDC